MKIDIPMYSQEDDKVEEKHIKWIDGLKGVSCMCIFAHHFGLAFFPAIHYGEASSTHLGGLDIYLSQSPFSFFLNGNFFVTIFCMLSSFVISRQIILLEDKTQVAIKVVKRYFRLMIPMLPIGIIVYILLFFGLFGNLDVAEITGSSWLAEFYVAPISLREAVKSMLVDTWFYGDNKLSNAYWMLSALFKGNFLSIVLSTVSWRKTKYTGVLYLLVAICLRNNYLQLAFVLGTLLAWIYTEKKISNHTFTGICFVLVGLFLGGYPSEVSPTNIYMFFSWKTHGFWHVMGSFCLIYGIFKFQMLQSILHSKVFIELGKVSYAVFLLHIPILFSISMWIFLWTYSIFGYIESAMITGIISSGVVLLISIVYHRYYIEKISLLTDKIVNFFVKSL